MCWKGFDFGYAKWYGVAYGSFKEVRGGTEYVGVCMIGRRHLMGLMECGVLNGGVA